VLAPAWVAHVQLLTVTEAASDRCVARFALANNLLLKPSHLRPPQTPICSKYRVLE